MITFVPHIHWWATDSKESYDSLLVQALQHSHKWKVNVWSACVELEQSVSSVGICLPVPIVCVGLRSVRFAGSQLLKFTTSRVQQAVTIHLELAISAAEVEPMLVVWGSVALQLAAIKEQRSSSFVLHVPAPLSAGSLEMLGTFSVISALVVGFALIVRARMLQVTLSPRSTARRAVGNRVHQARRAVGIVTMSRMLETTVSRVADNVERGLIRMLIVTHNMNEALPVETPLWTCVAIICNGLFANAFRRTPFGKFQRTPAGQ